MYLTHASVKFDINHQSMHAYYVKHICDTDMRHFEVDHWHISLMGNTSEGHIDDTTIHLSDLFDFLSS
jgi:hypothetical protein